MATHSNILSWEILWTVEPGRLQAMGSQRVGLKLVAKQQEQLLLMKQNVPLVALHSQLHVHIKIPPVTINNSLYLLFPILLCPSPLVTTSLSCESAASHYIH